MRLIGLCAAALGGVAVGDLGRLEPGGLVVGTLVAVLGAGLAWQRPAWRMLALLTCAAAVGGLRATLVAANDITAANDVTGAIEPYLGLAVRLRGVMVGPPSRGPVAAQFNLDVAAIGPAGRAPPPIPGPPRNGAVRVRVVGDPAELDGPAIGEALVLEGRLIASDRPGPPTLLYPRVLERAADHPSFEPSTVLGGLRTVAQAGIQRYLPEPQASLSAGVLLGGAGHLDADFRLQLQRSGLAHVVAIDGFKQVIVAAGLGAVAVRLLGPRAAAAPVLLGIAGYTLLTGAHPAAVRAGLMVALATLAALSGRLADPLTSVVVTATIMAAVDPRILLDVGLQLSLSATLGIILVWPRLRPCFKGLPQFVAEPAGLTLGVTLATLPVVLSTFQLVSLVSPLAHVLAVPLLPVVLLSAAVVALASPIPPVAAVVAWLAWLPSTVLVDIIQATGSLPGAALATGRLPPVAAAVLAAALLCWGIWGLPEAAALRAACARANHSGRFLGWAPAACMALGVTAALLFQVVRPDGRVHVQRLAQVRGEAVFIRGPTSRTVLVVGGRLDAVLLAAQVADHLAVWEHRLDAVLQLDPDAQAGLALTLARYPAARQLDAAADARLDLGGGAVLDVYASATHAGPAVSLSFGRAWLALAGRPPPATADGAQPSVAPPAANLVSDGIDGWATVR